MEMMKVGSRVRAVLKVDAMQDFQGDAMVECATFELVSAAADRSISFDHASRCLAETDAEIGDLVNVPIFTAVKLEGPEAAVQPQQPGNAQFRRVE